MLLDLSLHIEQDAKIFSCFTSLYIIFDIPPLDIKKIASLYVPLGKKLHLALICLIIYVRNKMKKIIMNLLSLGSSLNKDSGMFRLDEQTETMYYFICNSPFLKRILLDSLCIWFWRKIIITLLTYIILRIEWIFTVVVLFLKCLSTKILYEFPNNFCPSLLISFPCVRMSQLNSEVGR